MNKEHLIKTKKEAVNNKYDIRTIYYINHKNHDYLRFLSFKTANCFLNKMIRLNLI